MKKLLAALILAAVLFAAVGAYAESAATEAPAAEESVVDLSVLEASPYYTYDKFEKTWGITANWQEDYGSANGVIFVELEYHVNYFNQDWPPVLEVIFYDYTNSHYYEITGFRVIVGEKLYSFEKMDFTGTAGHAFGGTVMRQMMEDLAALAESDSEALIDFQVQFNDRGGMGKRATIEGFKLSGWSDIIALNATLEEAGIWDLYADPEGLDTSYGASVE